MIDVVAISPKNVRYIKLGSGGAWAERALARGEIHFGYQAVPHDMCIDADWDAVKAILIGERKSAGSITSSLREVREFYELDADTLWVTITGGHLHWTFAEQKVAWLGETKTNGARMRKSINGWKKLDIYGQPLNLNRLSSNLTQVAGYRGTICEVQNVDYLLRRINGVTEPIVQEANNLKAHMALLAAQMIKTLH